MLFITAGALGMFTLVSIGMSIKNRQTKSIWNIVLLSSIIFLGLNIYCIKTIWQLPYQETSDEIYAVTYLEPLYTNGEETIYIKVEEGDVFSYNIKGKRYEKNGTDYYLDIRKEEVVPIMECHKKTFQNDIAAFWLFWPEEKVEIKNALVGSFKQINGLQNAEQVILPE